MAIHEEYTEIIKKRYEAVSHENYEQNGYYTCVMMAPSQYLTEHSMLRYVQAHPTASLKELFVYFNKITPDGLAPGDNGVDLMDE